MSGTGEDIYVNIAHWIQKKKLTNRASLEHEHLICKIQFTKTDFSLDRLREEVQKLNPPTGAVWVLTQTDPSGGQFEGIEIFPGFGRLAIELKSDIPKIILPMYLGVEQVLKDQGLTWKQVSENFALVGWK